MASLEGIYSQECERAELLGVPKPTMVKFMEHRLADIQAVLGLMHRDAKKAFEQPEEEKPETTEGETKQGVYEELHITRDVTEDDIQKIMTIVHYWEEAMDKDKHAFKYKTHFKVTVEKIETEEELHDQDKANAFANLLNELQKFSKKGNAKPKETTIPTPSTSKEEAPKAEESQPSRWSSFLQYWLSFFYPNNANE